VQDGTLDWIKRFDWSREVVERAIISTAKNFERPIRPGEATSQALIRHISGETRALREGFHAGLLAATSDKVKQAAIEQFENNYAQGGVCVVSNRQKLTEAALPTEDIFLR